MLICRLATLSRLFDQQFEVGQADGSWNEPISYDERRGSCDPESRGKGVITVDGRMVELMHAEMARRTVAIAEAIGGGAA